MQERAKLASSTTPGPWRAQALNPREYIVWKQGYEGGGAVCRVDRSSRFLVGPLKESGGADATLIAASPDLLEAAEKALGYLDRVIGDEPIETAEEDAIYEALHEAVKKAGGR